jgi:chromosome partitioning protein
MRKIAILNQNGGVVKTTSCLNIGAGLADHGKQVLLIDLDPQSHLTDGLGVLSEGEGGKTVYDLMKGLVKIEDVIIKRQAGLDILPSDIGLSAAESELASTVGRELKLRRALNEIQGYDFVLVECPPSLGLLTVNALSFVDEIFITIQPEYFSLQGARRMLDSIELVKQIFNKGLAVTGVVVTLSDTRKNVTDVETKVRSFFGEKTFKTVIRDNVSLAEALGQGQSIFEYAPSSRVAKDYISLVKEILEGRS